MGHNGSPWGRSGVLRGGGGVPRLPTGVTAVSPWGSSRPPSHQRSRTGGLLGALLHARLSVPFSATVGDPKIVTSMVVPVNHSTTVFQLVSCTT